MTHTLHRLGNPEDLGGDYVVFAMSAKGINEQGSRLAMRRFFELALELDPVNAGDMKTGNILTHSRKELLDGVQDVSIVHAVFTDEDKVAQLLGRLREEDPGISVVVSGLFDRVDRCAHQAGLRPHTAECSVGVWGRTERLPEGQIMEITTMCGHGMVAAGLVEQMAHAVHRGRRTAEEAGLELARPCVCGILNPVRAARLLRAIAAREGPGEPVGPGQTTFYPCWEDLSEGKAAT